MLKPTVDSLGVPNMARKRKNLRQDKRFCVRLDIGIDENGKRKRKAFYSYESLDDAKRLRGEYIASHPATANPKDRDITLSMWAKRWLRVYKSGLKKNTQDGYSSAINALCKFEYMDDKGVLTPIGELKMTEIRQYHIQAYMMSLAGKSKSSIRIAKSTAKQLFEAAIDSSIISVSPIMRLAVPSGTYTGHRAIEEWEKKLIEDTWRRHRCGIWAMLMLFGGVRRGEMAAIAWDDLLMETKEMPIMNSLDLKDRGREKLTKTDAGERVVPILKPLYDALVETRPENASGRICLSAVGSPLTESSYTRGWESYMLFLERAANAIEPFEKTKGWRTDKARANPKHKRVNINAHDLRYTYATMLYDLDVDIKTAQYLLGHSDLETTMKIYTQLSQKKKASSIDKLVSHFEQQSDTQSDTQ